jgi:nucleoside 2-deoxyribosyltransferase
MKPKRLIYFAAPLFTQAEWLWNIKLAEGLRSEEIEIILPQDAARPMLYNPKKFDANKLFAGNVDDIKRADLVLAVFDQADPDSGTSWECGYAFAIGRPIIGVRTDIRRTGDDPDLPINLMLSKSCQEVLEVPFNRREDVRWVAKKLLTLIRRTQ